jgi:4-cresol dehydrogenase (hydroxylating) flavoprotein subunit
MSGEEMDRSSLSKALAQWRAVVGQEYVVADGERLAEVRRATFAASQEVLAVLRPANRDEVQACVRIANECRIPLYPTSKGKNWGYGSQLPTRSAVVIQLERMDRILEHDEELAYVVVEPGVSIQQLHDYLRERGSRLRAPAGGQTPTSSVLGNAVERGVVAGANGDRFSHCSDFEVVLPNGDCLYCGFERFEGAKAAHVHHWGVGPFVAGLFTQSNFGIITRMTLWLERSNEHAQPFSIRLDVTESLPSLIDRLRELSVRGLRFQYAIYNGYRVLAARTQYPWDAAGGKTPLAGELYAQLRQRHRCAEWSVIGTLFSLSSSHARADRRVLKASLRGAPVRLRILSPLLRSALEAARRMRLPIGSRVVTEPGPSEATQRLTYWRKRVAAPPSNLDPNRDQCGVFGHAIAIPNRGENVREVVQLIADIVLAAGFEPIISLIHSIDMWRSLEAVIFLVYDREVAEEDTRAREAHDQLIKTLAAAGYVPQRLGIHDMERLPPSVGAYGRLVRLLRRSLDPNDILAPGRYDFRHER